MNDYSEGLIEYKLKVEAEIERLLAALENERAHNKRLMTHLELYANDPDARNVVIEECAKVAEKFHSGATAALAIRALKG